MSIGFLTIAQNTDVDYLRLAYVQAMSVKLTMPNMPYAVIVDEETNKQITGTHKKVFDHIIILPDDDAKDDDWKLANEWKVFTLSPFKETLKVESDILFTRSIEHWKYLYRKRDLVMPVGCKNYKQEQADSRMYRMLFDNNDLPDIYSGLMYFRYCQFSAMFFELAKEIFNNWDTVKNHLIKCDDKQPTTDVVYAITAKILGVEHTTIPTADLSFVHMKPAINGLPELSEWHEQLISEIDLPMIRVGHINQYSPIHYQSKEWITDEIIEAYEQSLNRSNKVS